MNAEHKAGINAMLVLVQMMPEEIVIEKLEAAMAQYKNLQLLHKPAEEIKEAHDEMGFCCMLLLVKMNGSEMNPFKMIQDLERISNIKDLHTPNQG